MNNTQALQRTDSNNPDPDLISADPVIERVEKLDDWLEHREIIVEELCPVGALETLYAQRAALYLWRFDRVIGFENAAKISEIEVGAGKSLEDSQESRVKRDSSDQASLQTLIKYEAHLVRCLSSTMAELRRLQKERRQGLRDVNPGGRGADRAGVCEKEFDTKGSHGGSPSRQITRAEVSIPGGRGADRAGVCRNQQIKDGSPGGSPSQIGSPMQTVSPMRLDSTAADQKNRRAGSPGGSPSQTCSPSQKSSPMQSSSQTQSITNPEMSIPGGRGADRAGVCEKEFDTKGSHGGSPSQIGSPVKQRSTLQMESPMRTGSGKHRNSATRKHVSSQRAAPIPKTPPLLASITNRRRLEEYTLGEMFEPRSLSSTLNFAMIPSK